jgi:hypothetical protein
VEVAARVSARVAPAERRGGWAFSKIDSVFYLTDGWKDNWFERKKIKLILLFLFLPQKLRKRSYSLKTLRAWNFLCLKATGWGPPCHDQEKMAQFLESVGFFYFRCLAVKLEIHIFA